jgi:CRP-like cAMP-binding protein
LSPRAILSEPAVKSDRIVIIEGTNELRCPTEDKVELLDANNPATDVSGSRQCKFPTFRFCILANIFMAVIGKDSQLEKLAMSQSNRLHNRILERLPECDYQRIVGQMERISPALGEVVAYPDVQPQWVHFPISAVLSLMVVLEDGSVVEGSTLGNEGTDGLYLLTEPLANPYKINVQVEGDILRHPANEFKKILKDNGAMVQLLMRYALVSIQRGAQNATCIHHHTIEERMCHWLLETAHRKGQNKFQFTQEFLSEMLGVRRRSVNLTARLLQGANLIKFNRSEVTILDRAGLEEASCECFKVTSEMYERSMQLPQAPPDGSHDGTPARNQASSRSRTN